MVSPAITGKVTRQMETMLIDKQAIFTDRLNLKVQPEMRQELDRIAAAIGMSTSDVARWILTVGIESFNNRTERNGDGDQ